MTHSLWSWRFTNSAFPVPIWGRHNKTNAEHKEIRVLATEMGLLKLIWWVWTGCFCLQDARATCVVAWLTVLYFLPAPVLKEKMHPQLRAGWTENRQEWSHLKAAPTSLNNKKMYWGSEPLTSPTFIQQTKHSRDQHWNTHSHGYCSEAHTHTHQVHAVVRWVRDERQNKTKDKRADTFSDCVACRKHHSLQASTQKQKCGTIKKTDRTLKPLSLSYMLHSRLKKMSNPVKFTLHPSPETLKYWN